MDQNELEERMKLQKQIEMIEATSKQFLDREALSRLGNIRASNPEKAIQIMTLIFQAAQSGQIKQTLSDKEFKELLLNIQAPQKEFKIRRV